MPQPGDSLGPALEFTVLMMRLPLPPQSCFHTTNAVGRMLRFVMTVTEQKEMMQFYEGVETIRVCVYFYRTVLGSGLFSPLSICTTFTDVTLHPIVFLR